MLTDADAGWRHGNGDLLQLVGVSKSFDGSPVLVGVDLAVKAGEVHALVGENGAGKSTLIKVLGGVYQPDGGTLTLGGAPLRFRSPRDALAVGIVVIHQELSLAPDLSVEENIFLGRLPTTRFGTVDRRTMRRRAEALLAQLAIDLQPNRADGGSGRTPGGDPLWPNRSSSRPGARHRLHLASSRGDLSRREPGDGSARRPRDRFGQRRRHRPGLARVPHDRP